MFHLAVDKEFLGSRQQNTQQPQSVAPKLVPSNFVTERARPYVGADEDATTCAKILGATFPVPDALEAVQQKKSKTAGLRDKGARHRLRNS